MVYSEFPIGKKYNIIYADPPWEYSNTGSYGSANSHYFTMSLEDIKNLPVKDIAADNSLLFMWVTFPLLDVSFEVMKSWGFHYKTVAFNWVKMNKSGQDLFWGLGNWTRSNSEICLLGVRGNPKRVSARVHSVVVYPVLSHSKKPYEVQDRILQLAGDLPRIELFSRESCNGWDSWGNEVL